jgi:two-component system OmpR family sensor kinase
MTRGRSRQWRVGGVRMRVTLWYLGILLAALVIFGFSVYVGLDSRLRAEMDHALGLVAAQVADVGSRGRAELDADKLAPGYVASLHTPGGQVLATGPRGESPPWDRDARRAVTEGRENLRSVPIGSQSWRVIARPVLVQGNVTAVFQVARSEEEIDAALAQLRVLLMGLVPLALILAGVVGWFVAGRALDPIDRITRTAAAIGAEDLGRRLPEEVGESPDEVGRLAATFNRMLERLEGAFKRQRQFTADASHELRTPVTLLLTQLDVALARPRASEEYQRVLVAMREDVVRLQRLVNALLVLARGDAGQDHLEFKQLDLGDLAEQISAALQALAAERDIRLATSTRPGVTVQGDETRLTQLIVNLVDNGLAHTPAGGSVTVTAEVEPGDAAAVLSVRDTGVGIASEHLPHLFERFYRVDPSRSSSGGSGLGLAISRSIAEAHGGRIEVESQPGRGTTFRVRLPRPKLSNEPRRRRPAPANSTT